MRLLHAGTDHVGRRIPVRTHGPDLRIDDLIRENMSGNICRCGAYPNIVAAVRHALDERERGAAMKQFRYSRRRHTAGSHDGGRRGGEQQVPGRRDHADRSDEAGSRTAFRSRGHQRTAPRADRGPAGRRRSHRRAGAEQRGCPARVDSNAIPGPCRSASLRRLAPTAQYGNGGREHHAADPLLLLS